MDGIDLIDFNYSMKDIPICNRKFYTTKIFDETAKFINQMVWHSFLKCTTAAKNRQVMKPTMSQCLQIKTFKTDLFDVVKNIKLKNYISKYQSTLQSKIKQLLNVNKLIVHIDKISNLYYVDIKTYKKLIKETITKDYKLADDNTINHINDEAARIIVARNVKKKIPKYVTNEVFITLKDY